MIADGDPPAEPEATAAEPVATRGGDAAGTPGGDVAGTPGGDAAGTPGEQLDRDAGAPGCALFRAAIEAVTDVLVMAGVDGDPGCGLTGSRVIYANGAGLQFFGRSLEAVLGSRLDQLWPELDETGLPEHAEEILEQGLTHSFVSSGTGQPAPSTTFQMTASRVADVLVIAGRDVTAVVEAVSALVSSEERQWQGRQESISGFAAGIAHEFNTPIQFIADNTRFIADNLTEAMDAIRDVTAAITTDTDAATDLTAMRTRLSKVDLDFMATEIPAAVAQSLDGLQRVTEIVKALQTFSHLDGDRAETDLNELVESVVAVSRHAWADIADIPLSLDPDVGMVPCLVEEVRHVLLNLVANAARAIAERPQGDAGLPRGEIEVGTERQVDRAVIRVRDNGIGMDEQTVERIFDPFFTTSGVGTGHGRGLTLAYTSIVKRLGGSIDAASTLGVGTTILISLPLS
jgi:two-component system NtrC family sensor kinase